MKPKTYMVACAAEGRMGVDSQLLRQTSSQLDRGLKVLSAVAKRLIRTE